MSHVRAICQATIDHPHADGIVRDGGLGMLRQFPFRDDFPTRPGDLSDRPAPDWDYSSGGQHNVEPIPELNAVAPRGIYDCEHMTLYSAANPEGRWEPTNNRAHANCSNLWKELWPVGHPRASYLFFYDSRGAYDPDLGYYGEVTSRFDFHADASFVLRALRFAPNPTLPQAGFSFLELNLLGDSQSGQWSLVLPVAGMEGQARFPRLGWRLSAQDEWEVLTEFRTDVHEAGALRGKPFQQVVTWETVDGHFLLNIDGRRVVYYLPPERRVVGAPFIASGPLRIIVYGHAAAVNVTQVKYPLGEVVDCYARRVNPLLVDNTIFATEAQCRSLAWEPEGTTAVAEATRTTEGAEDRWAPRLRFTSPHNYRRAVAYLHQMDFLPTLSAGTSDPYETQGQNVLVSARGRLTNAWRNAECRVTLEVDRSAVSSLPEWKGNSKLVVVAGWDEGASQDAATQFTGYLIGATHVRGGIYPEGVRTQPHPERVLIDLEARDGFARLDRKYWNDLGCFVEWPLEEAFRRILRQCGIPDARITFAGDPDLVIPSGARRGDLRFDFPADKPVADGLDSLIQACGYVWGVDQTGTWLCRPPATYSGTPDFILDDDTLAADDVTFALRAVSIDDPRARAGFRREVANYVFVRIDRGGEEETAWRRDRDSHQTESAEDFVGDDWWHVFVGHDEQSASALAERILAERGQRHRMLHFQCTGKPGLFPDDFVEVRATGIGLPQGRVFQVVRKHWRARTEGEFVTEFACKSVGS